MEQAINEQERPTAKDYIELIVILIVISAGLAKLFNLI